MYTVYTVKPEIEMAPNARSIELMWSRGQRPRRGPKPALSVERIVGAAIELADADGLEAVSMERVAKEFGFTTMSLYRYVPGKAELIELMVDAALGDPPVLAGPPGAWRPKLETWAQRIWSELHRHPWALTVTGRLRVMGPKELAWLEVALAALAPTGLTAPERHAACLAVLAQVRTLAQFSVAQAREPRGISVEEWRAATAALLRDHRDRYPQLAATLDTEPLDPMTFGLRCVLDGIGVIIARRPARTVERRARPRSRRGA